MPTITLIKPAPTDEPRNRFNPGERLILVDGVRWGRTIVRRHGRRGTLHTFVQEGGGEIRNPPTYEGGKPQAVIVCSSRKRRQRIDNIFKATPDRIVTTEELVLEKAQQLIADDRLRDPVIVRKEIDARRAMLRQNQLRHDAEEMQAFRQRASEALDLYALRGRKESIDAIVAAMKWAQEQ